MKHISARPPVEIFLNPNSSLDSIRTPLYSRYIIEIRPRGGESVCDSQWLIATSLYVIYEETRLVEAVLAVNSPKLNESKSVPSLGD